MLNRKRTPFIRALRGASGVAVALMASKPDQCYTITQLPRKLRCCSIEARGFVLKLLGAGAMIFDGLDPSWRTYEKSIRAGDGRRGGRAHRSPAACDPTALGKDGRRADDGALLGRARYGLGPDQPATHLNRQVDRIVRQGDLHQREAILAQ